MKSKKITIVNINADDNAVIKNDDVETVEETKPVSADIKDETIGDEQQPVELKKIVKTTDLTECPQCHKMITTKTLKYSHARTCGIVKPPVEKLKNEHMYVCPVCMSCAMSCAACASIARCEAAAHRVSYGTWRRVLVSCACFMHASLCVL